MLFVFPAMGMGQSRIPLTDSNAPCCKVVGGLLTGSQMPANFNKRCVKANGESINVNVQISCVWSGGAPHFLVCYVRPREDLSPVAPHDVHPGAMRSRVRVMRQDDSDVSLSFSSGVSSPDSEAQSAMEAPLDQKDTSLAVESILAMSV